MEHSVSVVFLIESARGQPLVESIRGRPCAVRGVDIYFALFFTNVDLFYRHFEVMNA